MAPRKQAKPAPNRKIAVRRPRRQRRQRQNPTLGSLIMRGVNALMSVTPAANILRPVADFAFKTFGFSSSKITSTVIGGEIKFSGSAVIYGLGAMVSVPLSTIIENCPTVVRAHSTDTDTTKNRLSLISAFSHGQLLQIRITARPIGQLSTRQGDIALCFIPYTTESSADYYKDNAQIPKLQDVLAVPGAVQGPGSRTLTVNYRARGATDYCARPHTLETEIGVFMIAFQDLSRNKGNDFGPEDFGVEVIISGAIRLSNPIPHAGYANIKCDVVDRCSNLTIRVDNVSYADGEYDGNGVESVQYSGFNRCNTQGYNGRNMAPAAFGSPLSKLACELEEAQIDAN